MPLPSILILTHGPLAEALLASARTIVGDLPEIGALGLDWNDTPEVAAAKVAATIADLDPVGGLLVLTDIYGGTPFNVACAIEGVPSLEVVSGVNVPMVVRLCCGTAAGQDVHELASWLVKKAQSGICRSRSLTDRADSDPCGDPPR